MQKELGIRNKNVRKNVMLIVTENCPLRCTYCYETFKNINKRTMSFETAKQIVDFEMTVDDNYEEVVIDFFGGEPFVNFRLIEQIYDYLHSRAWPKKYICFATTNGVLVHGYIKAFLERHRKDFWCSLSIDGTPEMHNKNRSGSYNQIDVGWFSRMWPLQPVKMTISRETLPQLYDGVVYLLKKGFQISATFAQGGDFSGDETNAILEKQLERLVTFYLDNPQYPLVSLLDYEVEFLGGEKKENEKWCGCGDSMKSYDVCGNLYPCQCFTPLALEEKNRKQYLTLDFKDSTNFVNKDCQGCKYINICPTCYGANLIYRGDMAKRDLDMCKIYRQCIDASLFLKVQRIIRNYNNNNVLTNKDYWILLAAEAME